MMRWFHLIGVSTAITLFAIVLNNIYYPASFNDKGLACVVTNLYGEHWFEFILIFIGMLIFLHFIWVNMKENNL